jgi:hypothetical protein
MAIFFLKTLLWIIPYSLLLFLLNIVTIEELKK